MSWQHLCDGPPIYRNLDPGEKPRNYFGVLNKKCNGPRKSGIREERMKTGTDVTRNGLYASDCCLAERDLKKDAMFPRCVQTVTSYICSSFHSLLPDSAL